MTSTQPPWVGLCCKPALNDIFLGRSSLTLFFCRTGFALIPAHLIDKSNPPLKPLRVRTDRCHCEYTSFAYQSVLRPSGVRSRIFNNEAISGASRGSCAGSANASVMALDQSRRMALPFLR